MKKLYEKSDLSFAILWIIIYCVVSIPIRGSLGDESPVMTAALAVIAIGLFAFVKNFVWKRNTDWSNGMAVRAIICFLFPC